MSSSPQAPERADADWPSLLAARDPSALADLRGFLYRGLLKALAGRAGADAVEDFAQESVLKVLDGLASFRGDSRFLTWALAVGIRVAFSELRKAKYRDVSLDALREQGNPLPEPSEPPPDHSAAESRDAALATLRRLIDTELTGRQRALIRAELEGVPQAVIAERMGTNRNALYKLGHDARMKLKKGLAAAGVEPETGVGQ